MCISLKWVIIVIHILGFNYNVLIFNQKCTSIFIEAFEIYMDFKLGRRIEQMTE